METLKTLCLVRKVQKALSLADDNEAFRRIIDAVQKCQEEGIECHSLEEVVAKAVENDWWPEVPRNEFGQWAKFGSKYDAGFRELIRTNASAAKWAEELSRRLALPEDRSTRKLNYTLGSGRKVHISSEMRQKLRELTDGRRDFRVRLPFNPNNGKSVNAWATKQIPFNTAEQIDRKWGRKSAVGQVFSALKTIYPSANLIVKRYIKESDRPVDHALGLLKLESMAHKKRGAIMGAETGKADYAATRGLIAQLIGLANKQRGTRYHYRD